MSGHDRLGARRGLDVGGVRYDYYALDAVTRAGLGDVARLPCALKVLLENLLRHEDGRTVTMDDIEALAAWSDTRSSTREIAFRPARTLLQDFTGVPAVVDLAAMRQAMADLGGDPLKINPQARVDLVIDHSVMVDSFGAPEAFAANVAREFERNRERYSFLHWGSKAFDNFRVVPPGTGICHQVNLEYLARTVWTRTDGGVRLAYPDTLVGTDSHTTMVNGLAVLGWGVGGIEAEAAMLGQPISMLFPRWSASSLPARCARAPRRPIWCSPSPRCCAPKGVVGKFVEFFGPGLDRSAARRPGDHLQHGARIRRDLRLFPDRCRDFGAICAFTGRDAGRSPWSRLMPRRRGCGARRTAPSRRSPTP